MNNTTYVTKINHPEECPKCKSRSLRPSSEFDSEYHRHWVRMVCKKCHHQWTEVYQLDA